MVDKKRSNFGTEEDIEVLEERLLQLSKNYLSYKKRRYQDDPVEVLRNLYCLKEHEGKSPSDEKEDPKKGWISNFISRIPGLSGQGETYMGIDGNTYRESELQLWSQAHPLLLVLQKKIKEGNFDPNW